MELLRGMVACCLDARFVFFCFSGSVLGLFIGAIPGLSVSMATALLLSVTYTWRTPDALSSIMGVYVSGVFSGALSAILINIPGAPSSVVTTLDGYPLAKRGEGFSAIRYAAVYSFLGSVFGFVSLAVLAYPITAIALMFQPMDYFLLTIFGLFTVGGLTSKSISRGLVSAFLGIFFSLIGFDSVVGTVRLTFGIPLLKSGIPPVPALIGLFGFSEVLSCLSEEEEEKAVAEVKKERVAIRDILRKGFFRSLYYCTIGTLVGALPGAGGPVASFLAYGAAKRIVKNPETPFGQGAVEGIIASESANNACIGGALIPMLTLGIPGDAVTAIILSVFYVHGLKPGPTFLRSDAESFYAILAAGFLSCAFLLLLGLFVAPHVSRVIEVPKKTMLPVVFVLCVLGSYALNRRMFDVSVMMFFGVTGLVLRRLGYGIAPITLGLVLGSMMDANFRRAVSLASTAKNPAAALFFRPVTMALLFVMSLTLVFYVRKTAHLKR